MHDAVELGVCLWRELEGGRRRISLGQGEGVKDMRRTIEHSHCFYRLGSIEIGRVAAVVAHVWEHLAILGRGADLRVGEGGRKVGSK